MLRETGNEEQVLDRTAEVAASIAEEGLRYVSDSAPGYTRKRTGTTFSYYDGRKAHHRCRRHPAHKINRHPAGLRIRVDLPLGQRPHPGDRARCEGPQAVSLSPEVAGTP